MRARLAVSAQPPRDPHREHNVDVLINYERKTRELESLALLINELRRRGRSVGLSNTYDEPRVRFVERRRARVVVVPALYNDASLFSFVYRVAGACRKVLNLQWEQSLTAGYEADPDFYQNPKGLATKAVHLCWGEEPRQRMLRSGVPADRAIVVGPVHVDVLRPEMSALYYSKEDLAKRFSLQADSEWVLFISSFSFCNMPKEEFETERRVLGDWLYEFRDISRASQRAIVDWMLEAARNNRTKTFIYRPHPGETSDPLLAAAEAEQSNFRVIPDLTVRQWIRASDRLYTWYSTSAAEAHFLGKGCAVIRPRPIPPALDVSVFQGAKSITTREEFMSSLERRASEFDLNPETIRRYYAVDSQRPTYERICDVIETMLESDQYDMPPVGILRRTYYYVHWLRHRVFFLAKEVLVLPPIYKLLGKLPRLGSKLENHQLLLLRMSTDRWKNLASLEELQDLDRAIERIRVGGAQRECLSHSGY